MAAGQEADSAAGVPSEAVAGQFPSQESASGVARHATRWRWLPGLATLGLMAVVAFAAGSAVSVASGVVAGSNRCDVRAESPLELGGCVLTGMDLKDVTLVGANLRGATLDGVDLKNRDLRGADLRG